MAEASIEASVTRDEIIRQNIEAYLPYICDCIKATDLLVHLTYYTKEQRKEIYKSCVRNNSAAVRRGLLILLNDCDDPGRFAAFQDAMKMENGYPKIAQMLDGEYVPSDENYRKLVDLFSNELRRRIDPIALLTPLQQYGTITHTDAEEVRAAEKNNGQTMASWELLLSLPRRVEGWFKDFMNSLMDCHFDDVAKILEPDIYEKLLAQRKAETASAKKTIQDDVTDIETEEAEHVSFESEASMSEKCHDTSPNTVSVNSTLIQTTSQQPVSTECTVTTQAIMTESKPNPNIDTPVPQQRGKSSDKMTARERDFEADLESLLLTDVDKTDRRSLSCSELKCKDLTLGLERQDSHESEHDSLTEVKLRAQAEAAEGKLNNGFIRYDREFLLSLQDSPLTKRYPTEIHKFPEIVLKLQLNRLTSGGRKDNDLSKASIHLIGQSPVISRTGPMLPYGQRKPQPQHKEVTENTCVKIPGDMNNTNAQGVTSRVLKSHNMVKISRNEKTIPKHDEMDIDTTEVRGTGNGESGDQNKQFVRKVVSEKKIPKHYETDVDTGILVTSDREEPHAMTVNLEFDSLIDFQIDDKTMVKGQGGVDDNTATKRQGGLDDNTAINREGIVDDNTAIKGQASSDKNTGATEQTSRTLYAREDQTGADGNGDTLDFGELLDNDMAVARAEGGVPDHHNEGRADIAVLGQIADLINNLNMEAFMDVSDDEDIEWNIPTDVDEIRAVVDADIDLREYQKELAKEGCCGDNVIVMAPTNSGKTRTACHIMQVHLRRKATKGQLAKVIFLVENEALAFQQGEVCAELLPAYRTKVFSGSVHRDKKQYLWDFMDSRDILVVTAQVLLNALQNKEIDSLTRFSMIVFDECHHTDNFHRYNEIMSLYMDLKLKDKLDAAALPQIVGLTASLGVGGKTKWGEAVDHMKGLMANHDAKFLCTVRRHVDELKQYTNSPVEELVPVRGRNRDEFEAAIVRIKDQINDFMLHHASVQNLPKQDQSILEFCQVPASFGSEQFRQWLSDFKKALAKVRQDEVRRMLNPCRIHLEAYNQALLVHHDARISDAQGILKTFKTDHRPAGDDTDEFLLDLYNDFSQIPFRAEPENPKLVKLQEIILRILGNDENARGIMFVKTRELAKALINWMKETDVLKRMNATEFVGQTASATQGGMTKRLQKDVLKYFKGGRHKIIVATSVAEEGLDISKCNLVIRYEHVTNEIVRLQSRGRARAGVSHYYVVSLAGSWILAKEEKNAMLERLMLQIVPHLQAYIEDHQNIWEREILKLQEEQKALEDGKAEQRQQMKAGGPFEIQCLNCSTPICTTEDIRRIQGAHHVIIDEDCQERLLSIRDPHPRFAEEELKFDGEIRCVQENCLSVLGGVCEYKHTEFPLLKMKFLRIVGRDGRNGETFKQWKKANLPIEDFTLDDLREVVERRKAQL